MVLAHADIGTIESLYRSHTYPTPPPRMDQTRTAIRLRSQALRYRGDAHVRPIWQVACATFAAPSNSPPMSMRNCNVPDVVTLKDGDICSNNASEETYYETAYKHGSSKNRGPFVGLGTGSVSLNICLGKGGELKHLRNTIANPKTAMKIVTTTSGAQEKMIDISNDDGAERFHKEINPSRQSRTLLPSQYIEIIKSDSSSY